ncbi:MAG: hypothetical protein A2Y79_03805 [Deltaproteobacteria bacterium RBG_13_43_22]|nr:MAG: hypothetical protein A2Y79_03805 [Deltaproteobacteria bacterium RBG_13_43_22]
MEYDLFISHASEDKDDFVRPLAHKLRAAGLNVWYDEFTLTIGDSLSEKIDYGLENSKYGLVVLSKAFFSKNWTKRELRGLVAEEMDGRKTILPVWHGVTRDDVRKFSSPLADLVAISSEYGLEAIAKQIIDKVHPERKEEGSSKSKTAPSETESSDKKILAATQALRFLLGWSIFLTLIQVGALGILGFMIKSGINPDSKNWMVLSLAGFILSILVAANVVGAIPPIVQNLPKMKVTYGDIYKIRNYLHIPLWALTFLEHILFLLGIVSFGLFIFMQGR